jgi:succinate dehydrogenase / fumarate reductase cytochrome b subunit
MTMRRAVFFNIFQIAMPVGAVTSILHRISGVVLALGLPLLAWMLQQSVHSAQAYAHLTQLLTSWPQKIALVVFTWALAHHILAGVRHLLSDIDIGSLLPAARRSGWFVNIGAVVLAALALGALW